MTVNYSVLAEIFRITAEIEERAAVTAVIAVEILLEVLVVILGLHNLDVDCRIRNANPTDKVVVYGIEISVFRHHTLRQSDVWIFGEKFRPRIFVGKV